MQPLLENDKVCCPHNGMVQLKGVKGKDMEVKGVPVITQSDLQSAKIVGCTNNIVGVPVPCVSIPSVPPSVLSQALMIGGEGVVLADKISMVMTDQGVPLMLQGMKPASVELSK